MHKRTNESVYCSWAALTNIIVLWHDRRRYGVGDQAGCFLYAQWENSVVDAASDSGRHLFGNCNVISFWSRRRFVLLLLLRRACCFSRIGANQLRPWYLVKVSIIEISIAAIQRFSSGYGLFGRAKVQVILQNNISFLILIFFSVCIHFQMHKSATSWMMPCFALHQRVNGFGKKTWS